MAHSQLRRGRRARAACFVLVLTLAACGSGSVGDDPVATTVATEPSQHDRYGGESSASTPEGAAWEFIEGLSVRITGATLLDSALSEPTRVDAAMALVRIDFSYTNNGEAVHVSEGRQLPVRLLYGAARDEAASVGGYVGTSAEVTLDVPTRIEQGVTVAGAVSFAVPEAATDVLAVLVVEPFRYSQHLFTDVEDLLAPKG